MYVKRKEVKIKHDANLGIAMVVAECEGGNYQPVAAVSSINEAREIAAGNIRARTKELEHGGEAACPERYVVWATIIAPKIASTVHMQK